MPITGYLEYPILSKFASAVEKNTGMPPQPLDATPEQRAAAGERQQQDEGKNRQYQDAVKNRQYQDEGKKELPKGVVLGPDGKPCRTCTKVSSWMAMARAADKKPSSTETTIPPAGATTSVKPPPECPPDVDELGRSTWTLLHTMTANYPERPSLTQQAETKQFVGLFGKMYPCWVCADDFRSWIKDGNEPKVSNRDEFGKWMCEAHNAVNAKLGKKEFDCGKWEERWRTGWKDGRCD